MREKNKSIELEAIKERGGACKDCEHKQSFVTRIGNCLTLTAANVSVKVVCAASNSDFEIKISKKSSAEECVHYQRWSNNHQKWLELCDEDLISQ